MRRIGIVLALSFIVTALISCSEQPIAAASKGFPIQWRGPSDTIPKNPQKNWVYFNTSMKVTLIWSGAKWDTMTISGIDGVSIIWLGPQTDFPTTAPENASFFHTVLKNTYIRHNNEWELLAPGGVDGLSITWKDSSATHPAEPKLNWAYRNTTDKKSYIYNGITWSVLTADGIDGKSIEWRGPADQAPENPEINFTYYNTIDRATYIFTEKGWQIMCRDGLADPLGTSIVWLGQRTTPPDSPKRNWAYFNENDGSSYIFSDTGWTVFILGGKDGLSIIWKGELITAPENPEINWAYYDSLKETSYIWDGKNWSILCKGGTNGIDGLSIIWRTGTFTSHPENPEKNWAYYNENDGTSYIYNGYYWEIIARDGRPANRFIRQYVENGDTLILDHWLDSDELIFIGQYITNDGEIRNWNMPDESWLRSYAVTSDQSLFSTANTDDRHELFRTSNGILNIVSGGESDYPNQTRIREVTSSGSDWRSYPIADEIVSIQNMCEPYNRATACAYIDSQGTAKVTLLTPSKSTITTTIASDVTAFKIGSAGNSEIICVWIADSIGYIAKLFNTGTMSMPIQFTTTSSIVNPEELLVAVQKDLSTLIIENTQGGTTRIVLNNNTVTYDNNHFIHAPKYTHDPLVETDGSLTYLERISGGGKYGGYGYQLLANLSAQGESKGTTICSYWDYADFSKAPNGKYAVVHSQESFDLKSTMVSLFDSERNKIADLEFPQPLSQPRIAALTDNSFIIAYNDYYNPTDKRYVIVEESSEKPQLILKRMDTNRACLINNSGRGLELTLSVTKGQK